MNKTKVTCVFCRCLIAIKDGDKARFQDHMNNEHDVRADRDTMEAILVVTVMTQGERRKLINEFAQKVVDRIRPRNVNKESVNPGKKDNNSLEYEEKSNKIEMSDSEEKNGGESNKIVLSDSEEENCADNEDNPTEMGRGSNVSRNAKISSDNPPKIQKVEREGVLKCKFCSKYIRQSQMKEHKNIFHQNEIIGKGSPETERLLSEYSDQMKMSPVTNAEKRKESQLLSDDSDEDWSPNVQNEAKKKRLMIPCSLCKKRFGSKMTLTQHERTAHR